MIKRIVKLEFTPDFAPIFEQKFPDIRDKIEQYEGCQSLALYADAQHKGRYFTLSLWKTEEALETYRKSSLFTEVWADIKPHFTDKPLAWSITLIA